MSKFYIELRNGAFIVNAENAHDAIGKFWRRQLKAIALIPVDELSQETLHPFELCMAYAVHTGSLSDFEVVRSAKGIHSLNETESRLLAKCMAILHGEKALIETKRDLEG